MSEEVLRQLKEELLTNRDHNELPFLRSVLVRLIDCALPPDNEDEKETETE